MTYSMTPYLDALSSQQTRRPKGAADVASQPPGCCFALLDVGQFAPADRPLERLLARLRGDLLFEPSAGAEALELSPWLIELGPEPGQMRDQMAALDAVCGHLPALSILKGAVTREDLLQRLRFFMWVEADGTDYLLRLADTQSMQAVAAVLTPGQRDQLFAGLHGWWCVDYEGRLCDLTASDPADRPPTPLPAGTPCIQTPLSRFVLDAAQTAGVVRGTEVPVFAAQIRHFEPSFAQRLSHAQQAKFASDFLEQARLEAYEEGEMLGLARAQWMAMAQAGGVDA